MYEFHHDYNKNKYGKIKDETPDIDIKVSVRYFSPNFYFSPNYSPSKTRKNVFHFI